MKGRDEEVDTKREAAAGSATGPIRIGVIGVIHETNCFAPGMTELEQFNWEWVKGKEAYFERYTGSRTSMGGAIDATNEQGVELVPGVYMAATPSGMVSAAAGEAIIEELVQSIPLDIDGLLVILHGAMVSESHPDMEGAILRRIREKIGDTLPLAMTLDLHANMSQAMAALPNIVVGYDTYPHVDAYERAIEATKLLVRTARREIRPVVGWSQPALIIVPQAMITAEGAMRQLMERAFEIESRPGVLNVTVIGGFPYSDVADAGMAFVVTTDGDPELARTYAEELSALAWEWKDRFAITGLTAEAAVAEAKNMTAGPVILVEGSDNVGGGSPADATHLLPSLLKASCRSLIVIRDQEAALAAHQIGVGGRFRGTVGGKSDTLHGPPVAIEGDVRLLSDGKYRHVGAYMTGQRANMGRTAVIEAGQVTIVLTEHRQAPWDIGHVWSVGIRPEDYHIIVVKSAVAWKTAFGEVAKAEIQVDSPGCCSFNLQHFQYHHLRRPIYPLDQIDDWRER